jgi:hypothetical protein
MKVRLTEDELIGLIKKVINEQEATKDELMAWSWLLRRSNDNEIMDHLTEIVEEGMYHINPCDYLGEYSKYLEEVIKSSVVTFMYSYDPLDKAYGSEWLYDKMYYFIELRFGNMIEDYYFDEISTFCDE